MRRRSRRPSLLPGVDPRALRAGAYSDIYFLNAARVLRAAAREGGRFTGRPLSLRRPARTGAYRPGEARVEMQFFARRRPRFVAAGLLPALELLRLGVPDRAAPIAIRALPDGSLARPLEPVLKLRGRYRDFAHLETPLLGVLTRASRVATNVYEALLSARGKPVLFFPARFDLPQAQALDGYAYRLALRAHRRTTGRDLPALVSTPAQAGSRGGRPAGTVPHAYVLCFLGDTAEAMAAFCRHMPGGAPRVALVDTTNDCVGEAVRTARRLFALHLAHRKAGRRGEARRFVLDGVRADTAAELRDQSVPRSGDPRLERGVTPVLVRRLRAALDAAPESPDLDPRVREAARRYFRGVRIVASGGFDAARIRHFESHRAPVDVYGVGSHFLRGPATDFTADVVRVRIGARYVEAAKAGRRPRPNPRLRRVAWRR